MTYMENYSMEPKTKDKTGGLVQMIFLLNWVTFRVAAVNLPCAGCIPS